MVRENISPALFIFLSLAGGIFFFRFHLPIFVYSYLLTGCAILISSFGIAIYGFDSLWNGAGKSEKTGGVYKRIGVYSISFSFGLILALSVIMGLYCEEENRFLGVPYYSVTKLWGTVRRDSRYAESENSTRFTLEVKRVGSGSGEYVEGVIDRVSVCLDGKYFFYRGEKLIVNTPVKQFYRGGRVDDLGYKYMANCSTDWVVYSDIDSIEVLGFRSFLQFFRFRVINWLNKRIDRIGYPASELFRALFLGFKGGLNDTFIDTFRTSGTIHVLALSGLHVGIIFLIISFILLPFGHPIFRFVISIVLIFLYLFITGFSPSLVRAALMLFFFGFCKIMDRDVNPINIICLSAIVILMFSPLSLFSLSFQLSFLSILGIVTLGRWLINYLKGVFPNFIRVPLSFGLGAQIAVGPVLIVNFGVIYPIGIVASLIVVPLVTLFLWLGIPLVLLPTPIFEILVTPVSIVLDFLHYLILLINKFFSSLPGAKIEGMRSIFALLWGAIFLVAIIFLGVEEEGKTV